MTYYRTNNTRSNALNWPLGFGDIEKELNTLFAGLPGLFEVQGDSAKTSGTRDAKLRWYEKSEAYLVRIDLAGVKKDAISIELEDGSVAVSAVRKFETKDDSKAADEVKYSRTFRVPEGVEDGAIEASFEDGVLSLTLPKIEKVQPRQISVG